jgi:hypothetical protein
MDVEGRTTIAVSTWPRTNFYTLHVEDSGALPELCRFFKLPRVPLGFTLGLRLSPLRGWHPLQSRRLDILPRCTIEASLKILGTFLGQRASMKGRAARIIYVGIGDLSQFHIPT